MGGDNVVKNNQLRMTVNGIHLFILNIWYKFVCFVIYAETNRLRTLIVVIHEIQK